MDVDDTRLVSRARTGDAHAYAALLMRHRARLARACASVLSDDAAAADVAQEAALVAWLQLDRLRDPAQFGAWLTGIGRNLALSAARERTARRRWLSEDAAPPERPSATADDPAERALARERAADLAAAIAALPSGQRDALVLFHLADLPQQAVAARLTTGEGAVRTRLHKARTALRARLGGEAEAEPRPELDTEENDVTTTAMPAEIADVRRTPGGRHFVLLAVAGRDVPIWIGAPEAEALAAGLHDVERPRPDAHALALSLVRACGRAPERVRIVRLDAGIFYAEIVLDDGTAVDARPSDALVLAVAAGIPIEIDPAVVAATEDPLPEPYGQDLAAAPAGGAALLAGEVREGIAARAEELRRATGG
jgi:RNA polymerase sigma-70 factor, ECF subfamily